MNRRIRAGFVGFGEVNTPSEILRRKLAAAEADIRGLDWELTMAGLVTDDPEYRDADAAVETLKAGGQYDLIVLCVAGWIPTHAVIRVIERFRHIPMLVWGLCGWKQRNRLMTTADQAGTAGLCFTMGELGFRYDFVYSVVDRPAPVDRIDAFGRAAMTVQRMRDIRIGTMGYRDMLLYGTMFDGMSLRRIIGPEVEPFEMLEIVRAAGEVDPERVESIVEHCKTHWEFQRPVQTDLLRRGARYYLALDQKIRQRKYEAVSLIDVDGMKKLEGFPPAMVLMLLSDLTGVCTMPENDILGNVTQLIVRGLTGQDAHYMELYELLEDRILIGVPDCVPSSAVEGPVIVLPTSFGLLSGSIVNVSRVRGGQVTLVRLCFGREGYRLHVVTGTAVQPQPWEEYGWDDPAPQLPGLEVLLDTPVETFARTMSSQHVIVAYGDITRELQKWADLVGIQII